MIKTTGKPSMQDTPRLALVSAFEPEWHILRDRLEDPRHYELAKKPFVTGVLAGKSVVAFLSGTSMVNAVMSAQLAIDRFNVTGIVLSGVAGGADPAHGIGDVIVPERWGQYLEMVFARETEDGYTLPPFLKSDFPNFGMIFTINSGTFEELAGVGKSRFWFPADPHYLAAARRAAEKVTLARRDHQGRVLDRVPKMHVGGGGVSGTAFVDNVAAREWAHRAFGAKALDMETAAIAQVADANDVPFMAFRALSDLSGAESGENQFEIFMGFAAANLANVVEAFVKELA